MRRVWLAFVGVLALSFETMAQTATSNSRLLDDQKRVPFDFATDRFGPLMLHVSELFGVGVWPRLDGCRDENADRPGFCAYRLSEAVSIVVVNGKGSDRPHQVAVSWSGDRFGIGLLANTVRGLGHVLSPAVQDGSQDVMVTDLMRIVQQSGVDVPERQWSIGPTLYTLRPDPHLGSRSNVLFLATDQR